MTEKELIIKRLLQFRKDRDWEQFHTPGELARAIMIEAAELNECYLWGNEDKQEAKEELADILVFCLYLAEHYNWDIWEIMHEKIDKNEVKYPVEKAIGNSNKYNKL